MNDYREVQAYLSHGLFDKKKKQYYKTDANDRSNYFSNIFESKEAYDKRVQKYKTDKRVAAYNKKKSMDSIERTANHIDLMKLRAPYLKSFRDYANKLAETYSVITNAKADISNAGSNSSLISAAKNKIANAEKKIESLSSKLEQASYMITGAGFSKEESLAANAIRNYKENGVITEEGAKKAAQLFHSGLEEYLAHGYEAAMHNKKQSQESVRRQDEDVNGTVRRLKDAAIKDIMFYIKDYNNIIERDRQKLVKAKNMLNSPAGTQAKSSYVKTNSGQSSIREEIKVIEYWMNKNIEKKEELEKELQEIKSDKTGKKAKAYVDGHKHDLHHSSLEEEYMNSEYTEINAYLQHGLFDIFKSKPKYNSTGSAAGMPSNIHLGDSYNPTARASAIQDEIVRISKKLAEYENGEVKAKADYDRYKKLVKETKAKLSDLEKARANAITQSVNSNTKQTTVTSSAPNKTKLIRTNPIFDRDVANLRKKR